MNTQKNAELMQDLSRGPQSNIFSSNDQAVVRKAVAQLQGHEHSVVVLRFWEANTISEIAGILDLTWQEVESYLTQALIKLKSICLKDREFSRSGNPGGVLCGNSKVSAA